MRYLVGLYIALGVTLGTAWLIGATQPPIMPTPPPAPEKPYYETVTPQPGDADFGASFIERQIPPNHFCMKADVYDYNVAHGRRDDKAHPCTCHIVCTTNPDGTQDENSNDDQPGCKTDCHHNGRSCTCHVEEPCPGSHPNANAYADMNGHIVAMVKR